MNALSLLRAWLPTSAVICFLVGATQPGDLGEKTAALLLVVRLALGGYGWIQKTSGRIAIVILMVSLLMQDSGNAWSVIYDGIGRYVGVVVLVLSISFLRLPLEHIRLGGKSAPGVGRRDTPLAAITTASCAISPLLNLGTIALLGGLLEAKGRHAASVSSAVTRGVGAALLISPTFAPTAIVMREFPDVTWASTLPLAAPLFVASLTMAWLSQSGQSVMWVARGRAGLPTYHLGFVVALMALFLVLFRGLFHWPIVMSVSAAAILSVFAWAYLVPHEGGGVISVNLRKQVDAIWPSIQAEAALFIVAGILASTLSTSAVFRHLVQSYVDAAVTPLPLFLTIIVGMPFITIFGIHPIVPFVVLVHLIDGATLGLTASEMYVLWVVSWVLSMMVSPVSALNVSAATFFHVSPWAVALRENIPHAIAFGAISLALFWTIGG